VTARANSVLPVSSPRHLAGDFERVEALYRAHNLPPTFQIIPAAEPSQFGRHAD
jgi:N-acetylglutamate synthase